MCLLHAISEIASSTYTLCNVLGEFCWLNFYAYKETQIKNKNLCNPLINAKKLKIEQLEVQIETSH